MRLIKRGDKYFKKNAEEIPVEEALKQEKENLSCAQCIHKIVAYNGGLQIAHWRADTKSNEHKTLGDLYEEMIDLIDTFAESYMGKYGVIDFEEGFDLPDISGSVCTEGLARVADLESVIDEKDDDLLNITADMKNALNKAKYLLKE